MCCCPKPTINGEDSAYSWDGKSFSTRKPWFPELNYDDELIRDLPGRCGGTDSHSFDMRLVRQKFHGPALLVHSGLGDTRINLHLWNQQREVVEKLDEDTCYWLDGVTVPRSKRRRR